MSKQSVSVKPDAFLSTGVGLYRVSVSGHVTGGMKREWYVLAVSFDDAAACVRNGGAGLVVSGVELLAVPRVTGLAELELYPPADGD